MRCLAYVWHGVACSNYAGLVPPHSCANVQHKATRPYDNKVSGTDPSPNPVSTSQSTRIRGVHHQIWLMQCSGPILQASSVLRENPVVNSIPSLFLFTGEFYEAWNCFCLHRKHTHSWATHNSRDSCVESEVWVTLPALRVTCRNQANVPDIEDLLSLCWSVWRLPHHEDVLLASGVFIDSTSLADGRRDPYAILPVVKPCRGSSRFTLLSYHCYSRQENE